MYALSVQSPSVQPPQKLLCKSAIKPYSTGINFTNKFDVPNIKMMNFPGPTAADNIDGTPQKSGSFSKLNQWPAASLDLDQLYR